MGAFMKGLSDADVRMARRAEALGVCSFSKAVKLIQRGEALELARAVAKAVKAKEEGR